MSVCVLSLVAPTLAEAHAPILSCYDNDDGTISCEAGYSDGSSSAGQQIRVVTDANQVIIDDVFKPDGTFTFDRPTEDGFFIEFIGDPSHNQKVFDDEIY